MTVEKETKTSSSASCKLPQLSKAKCTKTSVMYKNGARYHGEVCGNKRSGHGLFSWPNGAHYDGEFVDNIRHGKGIQEWPDGSRYDGEFADDCRHGYGQHNWPSGEVYTGSFYKDRRHGYGVYTWPDGSHYCGTFYMDKKEGYGMLTFANGNKFEGLYKDDEREGPGIATYVNGTRDVGLWHRERLIKLCVTVNAAEFSLESYGFHPKPDEHRVRLSKSAYVNRRHERLRSAVAIHKSPEPLDYEFEPDPETILRAVVSDLLPSSSLAADFYAYDEAFFAAARCKSLEKSNHSDVSRSTLVVPNTRNENDTAVASAEIPITVNNRTQPENCSSDVDSTVSREDSGVVPAARMSSVKGAVTIGNVSCKSTAKTVSCARNDDENEDAFLAWNNTPSCVAMQTNILRHQCAQNSVSFDVEMILRGERGGDRNDRGPVETASERLILAAGAGDLSAVIELLDGDMVNVDVADVNGRTSLFAATVNCHQDVINYLLDNGADVNKLDDEGLSTLSACFIFLCPLESFLDNAADGVFSKRVEITGSEATPSKKTRTGKSNRKPTVIREPSKMDVKRIHELREEYGNSKDQPGCQPRVEIETVDDVRVEDFIQNGNTGDPTASKKLGNLSFHKMERLSSPDDIGSAPRSPLSEANASLGVDATSRLSHFESHQTVNNLPVKVTDRQIERCATILSTNEMIVGRSRSARQDVWSEGVVRRLALEKSKWQCMQSTMHLLLKRGANPNASTNPMPVLFFAIRCGDATTVRELLEKGANPGVMLPESLGRLAPLHYSCGLLCKEGIEITKLLLNALADPDVRAMEDNSFLNHFLEDDWSKDELTVENMQILGGRTPLHIACAREDSHENSCEVVKLLLQHHANTRVLCNGHSPLTLAITRGNDLAVHVLLASGADPNLHHSHGIGSALCAATFTENESRRNPDARIALIDRLINAGANMLVPIAIGPRRQIGTVVDYANYVYNLDQRVGHVPYHALTGSERETFNARHKLLEHIGHRLRQQAIEQERQRLLEEEKAGKLSRNPSASFLYVGHGARLESALLSRKKPTSASSSSLSSDADVRKPLFRYCYECGRCINVRLTPCPRCKEVYYCSKPCQNKAWALGHKDECLRIPLEGRSSGREVRSSNQKQNEEMSKKERGGIQYADGKFGNSKYGLQGAKDMTGVNGVNDLEDRLKASELFPVSSWKDGLPENCYIGNYSYI
jgi:ankyrin repeat protein